MPIKAFLKSIYKKSPNKMRANWEIGHVFKVGDVGKLENGTFVRYTSLKERGIPLEVLNGPKEVGKLDLSSEKGITINPQFKVKGDSQIVELNGEAAFVINFEKANSFIFRADGVQASRIKNLEIVENEVLSLYNKGKWDKDYVIISDVLKANSITILLTGEAGVKTTLSANGKFKMAQLDIADASVGFSVSSTNKLAVEIVGSKDTTPLFKVKGIRRPIIFGSAELVGKGKSEEDGKAEASVFKLMDIPFDDDLKG